MVEMSPECANCDGFVSADYARVFGVSVDGERVVQACPECPDMVRGPDGRARRSRNAGGEGR